MGSVVDSDLLVAELVRHQRRIYIFIGSLLPNPATRRCRRPRKGVGYNVRPNAGPVRLLPT